MCHPPQAKGLFDVVLTLGWYSIEYRHVMPPLSHLACTMVRLGHTHTVNAQQQVLEVYLEQCSEKLCVTAANFSLVPHINFIYIAAYPKIQMSPRTVNTLQGTES